MGDPAKKRATYDDLYALPESVIGEIIDGELTATPRPAPRHARALSVLGSRIGPVYDTGNGHGPGGWIILIEPEVQFPPRGVPLVPDLAGWKRERFRETPGQNWVDVVPDWVCEVLSPSTAKRDRSVKMSIYQENAEVHHVWLVDPLNRTLEVFGRGEAGAWVNQGFFEGDETVRSEPFPAAEFALSGLWLE